MSTFYVKKNGSGTHNSIQSAIYDAQDGDIINIGEGTWSENIELYKAVELVGDGKDLTFVQGQEAAQTFVGGSFYQGEDIITVPSTTNLVRGRRILGTNLTANSRISEIVSATQFRVSPATVATAIAPKTAVSVVSGSNTITLPNTTSLAVGMKVTGTGVSGVITAMNATTKVITLDTPNTANGSNVVLTFRTSRTNVTLTMPSTFSGSTIPATIQVMNVPLNGWKIKEMTVTGFDNTLPSVEAAAIGIVNPASGKHMNWMIDGCRIVANGDSGILSGSNLPSENGTIQNCIFEGKTFTGSQPAEVPNFSTGSMEVTVVVVTGTNFTVEFPSSELTPTAGGSSFSSPSFSGTASFASSTPGTKRATLTKASSGLTVGQAITLTFNMQTCIPNVPRQMVVIGNSGSVSNCINTSFLNNVVNGQTGAQIGSNKNIFNAAVTVDTVGGLIEGNEIDGNFGSGENTLFANWAIRSRGASVVVQNNTNRTSGGRGNSGFYIPLGTSLNNVTINALMIEIAQQAGDSFVEFSMQKDELAAMSAVSSHPVFSNQANWNMVSYVFKHDSSARRLVGSFKDFSSPKSSKLKPNMAVGDKFELHKIILATSPRDLLVLKRSEISGASGFDFNLVSDGPEESNGGGGNGGGGPAPVQTLDFTTGVMPSGISLGGGVLPSLANNCLTFEKNSNLIVRDHVFTASSNYKVRIHIKDVSKGLYTAPIFYLQNLYGNSNNVILETQPFVYQSYNPSLDMDLHKNSFIEYTFQSGIFWGDGSDWFGIVAQNLDDMDTTDFIKITKIEIFQV